MMKLEHELTVAKSLALEAGALLLRHREGPIEVRHKPNGEVVTVADTESDALIRAGLASAFPLDAIFSEETADSPDRLSSPRVWIVDPMDGTSNFIERGDEFTVSIGLAVEGRAVLGVVYNPVRDELFAGCEPCGVTLNGAPARASMATDLRSARLAVSRKEWKGGLHELAAELPIAPRASVAYKLARVAAGLDDGMFSAKFRKQWDICAGVALVLASGGRVTLLDGGEIRFNRLELKQPLGMVASGPGIYPVLMEAVRRLLPLGG
jgi:fructose-1,6-bisphosphatase/inositol monophosphatase family enzyme